MPESVVPPDHPGVHLPPPLVYIAAMGVGALFKRYAPLPIGGDPARVPVAWVLAAVAAVIAVSSFRSFWSRGTTILPMRPATALVLGGPYRFTRNPMYVALALLTAGVGLWLNTWWVLLLLVPAVLVIDRFVIQPEEQYLRRRFGADYEAYTRRVRRWI